MKKRGNKNVCMFDNADNKVDMESVNVLSGLRPALLLNLSNHPYKTWNDAQRTAASVYGECIDIVFPHIDAMADERDIKVTVDKKFAEIMRYTVRNTVTVHIMGEMTFCFSMICLLKSAGIECIASCTRRKAEEYEGIKTSVFEFERFRKYVF